MSLNINDEFAIFPCESRNGVTTLDIGYPGSHGPRYLDESDRQHRPTEPEHETLRCSETYDSSGAPGPGREGRLYLTKATEGCRRLPKADLRIREEPATWTNNNAETMNFVLRTQVKHDMSVIVCSFLPRSGDRTGLIVLSLLSALG